MGTLHSSVERRPKFHIPQVSYLVHSLWGVDGGMQSPQGGEDSGNAAHVRSNCNAQRTRAAAADVERWPALDTSESRLC